MQQLNQAAHIDWLRPGRVHFRQQALCFIPENKCRQRFRTLEVDGAVGKDHDGLHHHVAGVPPIFDPLRKESGAPIWAPQVGHTGAQPFVFFAGRNLALPVHRTDHQQPPRSDDAAICIHHPAQRGLHDDGDVVGQLLQQPDQPTDTLTFFHFCPLAGHRIDGGGQAPQQAAPGFCR